MAITKIQSESMNLADTYAFTGTVTGAGESNTPSFFATINSQTVPHATHTVLAYNSERYDTASAFDTSTYKFTVPSGQAGKYYFTYQVAFGSFSANQRIYLQMQVNDVQKNYHFWDNASSGDHCVQGNTVIDLSASDTVKILCYHTHGSDKAVDTTQNGNYGVCFFGGFKVSS